MAKQDKKQDHPETVGGRGKQRPPPQQQAAVPVK